MPPGSGVDLRLYRCGGGVLVTAEFAVGGDCPARRSQRGRSSESAGTAPNASTVGCGSIRGTRFRLKSGISVSTGVS